MAEKVVVIPRMFACLDAKGENYIVRVKQEGHRSEHARGYYNA